MVIKILHSKGFTTKTTTTELFPLQSHEELDQVFEYDTDSENSEAEISNLSGSKLKTLKKYLNPITYGGGGLFGKDYQIIDHNSKTALSSTSKLGDF